LLRRSTMSTRRNSAPRALMTRRRVGASAVAQLDAARRPADLTPDVPMTIRNALPASSREDVPLSEPRGSRSAERVDHRGSSSGSFMDVGRSHLGRREGASRE
jgi:hypothetical protein